MSVREFTEWSYIMSSLDFFWTKSSTKYDFLQIYRIFNMTDSTNLAC